MTIDIPAAAKTAHHNPADITADMVHPCSTCGARPLGVCADLKGHELQSMACASIHVNAASGEALFHEGDPNPFVFNVIDGAVKLYRLLPDGRRQITGFLFQGDFLGLGGRGNANFTAEALTPLTACRFRRTDFDQLLNALPALEHRLVAMAGDELMAAQEQIVLLGRKTARERLASFLVRLSERQKSLGGVEGRVHLPMTRLDIADYLGLTIETVSRVLTQFKTSSLIQLLPNNEVALLNETGLQDLADGAA